MDDPLERPDDHDQDRPSNSDHADHDTHDDHDTHADHADHDTHDDHADHDHHPHPTAEERVTAPMQDFSTREVRVGVLVLVVGFAVTFGLPLLL